MSRLMIVALALFAGPAPAQPAAAPEAPVDAPEAPAEAPEPPAEAPEAPAEAPEEPAAPDPPGNPGAEAPPAPPAAAEAPPPVPTPAPAPPAPAGPQDAPAAEVQAPTPPAPAPPTVHLTMRWGMHIYPDTGYWVLSDDQHRLGVEIDLDVNIVGGLSVGLGMVGGGEGNLLYDESTTWQDNAVFLSARYRHSLHPVLSVYGRLGPTVHWYAMDIGDTYDTPRIEIDEWQFGARAAVGLEFWPVSPAWTDVLETFSLGVVAEAYYDYALPTEWRDGQVDLGPFDPSGPGWTLGITTRF